jgi:hypothetical protein
MTVIKLTAGGTINAGRFVALSGGQAVQASSASASIIGISERAAASGELASVIVSGFADLDMAAVVAAGGYVKADSNGKGVEATASALTHARIIDYTGSGDSTIPSTASGDTRKVLLVEPFPYFSRTPLLASATLNFGSISAGATAELTTTVTGAATGDIAYVNAPSLEANLQATAAVTGADTVTVRVANISAGSIDPASQSYLVRVEPAT